MKNKIRGYLSLILLVCLAACNAAKQGDATNPDQGTLRVALEYRTDQGVTYYLRDAHLTVIGEQETSFEVGDESIVRIALVPGDYTLELQAGWWIEREEAGSLEPIDAELVSANPTSFSITSGEETSVSFHFVVAGEAVVFESGELVVDMEIEVADGGWEAPDDSEHGTHLVINEVDYDQAGTDDSEFIEIFNPTSSAVSIEGLVLELINGADGAAQVYGSIDLAQAGQSIPAYGYLVVGSESLISTLPESVPSLPLARSIQNGVPDGVRVSDDFGIVDSLSYGGIIDGVTEGDSAPVDSEEGSIGRCENGTDTDDNATDFRSIQPSTPGLENICVGADE